MCIRDSLHRLLLTGEEETIKLSFSTQLLYDSRFLEHAYLGKIKKILEQIGEEQLECEPHDVLSDDDLQEIVDLFKKILGFLKCDY